MPTKNIAVLTGLARHYFRKALPLKAVRSVSLAGLLVGTAALYLVGSLTDTLPDLPKDGWIFIKEQVEELVDDEDHFMNVVIPRIEELLAQ